MKITEYTGQEIVSLLSCNDTISDTLKRIEKLYDIVSDELDNCNDKQSDILHEIEKLEFNQVSAYYKLKELKELRKYRRIVSNLKSLVEPVIAWINVGKNPDTFAILKKNMENILERQRRWVYNFRIPEAKGEK